MAYISRTDVKKAQKTGSLVCNGCSTDNDYGIEPENCDRIKEAIAILNDGNYMYQDLRE